jgi:hypothetical protein
MSHIVAYVLMINIDNIMEEVAGVFANHEDALKYAENNPLNGEVGYYIKFYHLASGKDFFIQYL